MAVNAVQHIRRMRGGSQSHLMLADDDNLYVVKFQNNTQGVRILANEWFATGLARALGLSVPECDIVSVAPSLIAKDPNMIIVTERGRSERCLPGLHFGSRFVGGLMPGLVLDFVPSEQLCHVSNLHEFAGMLAFDKWTCNHDVRQAVFHKRSRHSGFEVSFIDHGFCFGANEWAFEDNPLWGMYPINSVYEFIKGWTSFEPWLGELESLPSERIRSLADTIPLQWYNSDKLALAGIVMQLTWRRQRVRDLLEQSRHLSSGRPFPRWQSASE